MKFMVSSCKFNERVLQTASSLPGNSSVNWSGFERVVQMATGLVFVLSEGTLGRLSWRLKVLLEDENQFLFGWLVNQDAWAGWKRKSETFALSWKDPQFIYFNLDFNLHEIPFRSESRLTRTEKVRPDRWRRCAAFDSYEFQAAWWGAWWVCAPFKMVTSAVSLLWLTAGKLHDSHCAAWLTPCIRRYYAPGKFTSYSVTKGANEWENERNHHITMKQESEIVLRLEISQNRALNKVHLLSAATKCGA